MSYDLVALKGELERDEGRTRMPYTDTTGNLTIGVGHNLAAKGLTQDVIDLILEHDIADAEQGLDAIEPRWRTLDDNRQRVLMNFIFNVGRVGILRFHDFWTALRGHLDTGSHEALKQAAEAMRNSLWYKQVGGRAERLAARMEAE